MPRSSSKLEERKPETKDLQGSYGDEGRVFKDRSEQQKPEKSRLEKTQSMLTLISTTIGLIGIAGSTFAFAVSSFYTGSLEVQVPEEIPGMSVKVHTEDGHESVFYSRSIKLMPGNYALEICFPGGKSEHKKARIKFNEKTVLAVNPANSRSNEAGASRVTEASRDAEACTESAVGTEDKHRSSQNSDKKKRWWQFWRKSPAQNQKMQEAVSKDPEQVDAVGQEY